MSALRRAPAVLPVEAVVVVLAVVTAGGAVVVSGTGAAARVGAAVGAGTNVILGAAVAGAMVARWCRCRRGATAGSAVRRNVGPALGVGGGVGLYLTRGKP